MRFIFIIPLLAVCTTGCVGVAVRAAETAHRPQAGQMFENADANGDGKITRSEFTDARGKAFAKLDRDGDGYLTSADAPRGLRARRGGAQGGGGQGGAGAALRAMDADGDGRISRQEFISASLTVFDRADTNHDGEVDAQERAAFDAEVAGRRGR